RKMRAEQKSRDLKHVEGGLIDLEFCVQALVLAYGPLHPGLRENKGNHTLLKRAAELGLAEEKTAFDAERLPRDARAHAPGGIERRGDGEARARRAGRRTRGGQATAVVPVRESGDLSW